MNPATADECQSPRRPWWQNKYCVSVIHDIVMSSLLIVLNVAIIWYITHHKIHLIIIDDGATKPFIWLFSIFYFVTFTLGVAAWLDFFTHDSPRYLNAGYLMGVSHFFALVPLMFLIHSIHPVYCFYFGIPCAVWLVIYLAYTLC